jgi:hypothetical protein
LYERVGSWEGRGLAARVAQELIHLDLLAGRTGYALRLARERPGADPAFRPQSAADTQLLARVAAESSDRVTAAALLREPDAEPDG